MADIKERPGGTGRARLRASHVAHLALLPAAILFLAAYGVSTAWSIYISTTASRMLPNSTFVGLRQYVALFGDDRWTAAARNILVFGPLTVTLSLALGTAIAVAVDRNLRGEHVMRSLFLYPYAMSFVVTGLLWRWLLDPTFGLQSLFDALGLGIRADWLVRDDAVVYTLVAAAVWHGSGLVMTLVLSGLRGIDPDIWSAARVDGIPVWRTYSTIVLPMLGGSFATALVLLALGVVKLYDLVVAMTAGGPGFASEMPAKVVMDALFERQNIGFATAGATVMLVTVAAVVTPLLYLARRA